jgi:hypothetical protein
MKLPTSELIQIVNPLFSAPSLKEIQCGAVRLQRGFPEILTLSGEVHLNRFLGSDWLQITSQVIT